jgi:hypothetical protein
MEIWYSISGLHNITEEPEERISEPKETTIEMTQPE